MQQMRHRVWPRRNVPVSIQRASAQFGLGQSGVECCIAAHRSETIYPDERVWLKACVDVWDPTILIRVDPGELDE